jgi:hypothetical protein
MKTDPGFPLNCPHCGEKLAYVRTEGEIHFYRCSRHGPLILPPDGRIKLDDPRDSATKH